MIALTSKNYTQVNEDEIAVIRFHAPWCGPCKAFEPTFKKATETRKRGKFYGVNVEELPDLGTVYEIRSIPQCVILSKGVEVYRFSGVKSSDIVGRVLDTVEEIVDQRIAESG